MSAGVSAAAADAEAAGDSAATDAGADADAAAVDGDGVLPPPVEQAPSSTSSYAPRASVRFNRMGVPPQIDLGAHASRERLGYQHPCRLLSCSLGALGR